MNYNGKCPVTKCSFIAPTASIIGRVHIGVGSSVWYGAIIRGNKNYIKKYDVFKIILFLYYFYIILYYII